MEMQGQPAAGLPDDTGRTRKGVCGIEDALTSNDYKEVLRVFNEKSLVSFIASCLGLKDGVYCRKVIALLQQSLRIYLPKSRDERAFVLWT